MENSFADETKSLEFQSPSSSTSLKFSMIRKIILFKFANEDKFEKSSRSCDLNSHLLKKSKLVYFTEYYYVGVSLTNSPFLHNQTKHNKIEIFYFLKMGQSQLLFLFIFILFKHNFTEKLYASAGFEPGLSE